MSDHLIRCGLVKVSIFHFRETVYQHIHFSSQFFLLLPGFFRDGIKVGNKQIPQFIGHQQVLLPRLIIQVDPSYKLVSPTAHIRVSASTPPIDSVFCQSPHPPPELSFCGSPCVQPPSIGLSPPDECVLSAPQPQGLSCRHSCQHPPHP